MQSLLIRISSLTFVILILPLFIQSSLTFAQEPRPVVRQSIDRALFGSISVHSQTAITEAQRRLREGGYYKGPIDGNMTDETREAIIDFQDDKELNESGLLDLHTSALLGLNVVTVSNDDERVILYNLDPPDVIAYAQKSLTNLGHYEGAINGEMTEETRNSLKRFQSEAGLSPTGSLDKFTANRLGLKAVIIEYENDEDLD
jgi:peptidoglycan hydrolase-like protein with peptidoglycan-binding domain